MGDIFQRKKKLINKIEITDLHEKKNGLSANEKDQHSLLKSQLAKLISHEELYWWQRAREQWIDNKDSNTRFFHIKACNQKKRNQIDEICVQGRSISS